MKIKNRKGSTLALTIMIFAVLMIFATFTLGFMVTENKQAIRLQNKTQSYITAKSAVEVVEHALKAQLYTYINDEPKHKAFVNLYDSARSIDLGSEISNLDGPVIVVNDTYNGRRVMTIQATSNYNGVKQTVKKVLYSYYTMRTLEGFAPGGNLFVYLGDTKPQELLNSGSQRDIPEAYVTKVPEDEKDDYTKHNLPVISNEKWGAAGDVVINSGFTLPDETGEVYVNGNLTMSGNITLNGDVKIHVRKNLYFTDDTTVTGQKDGQKSRLKIYVYNEDHTSGSPIVAVSNNNYYTTSNNGDLILIGDLYVEQGNIYLGFAKNSYIDGHIIYNGNGKVEIKTNSNSYNQDRIITGSVYAPFGSVHLGIYTYQIATIIGGQIIADAINVYPANINQGNKFYENSTAGRIDNNPIPVDITEGIDIESLEYRSFFVD